MKKAVIFDMDGVLIDSEPFYFERRMDFFKAKGIQPGSDRFEDYVGNSENQTWQMLVPDNEIQRNLLH
ncbi:MAG: HAD hydrolase-like protein, partial [Enterococcus sp.]|nr:HAD hydrolase-like protein [Enterococcus sp.]